MSTGIAFAIKKSSAPSSYRKTRRAARQHSAAYPYKRLDIMS
jgi:hypothetical protein